MRDSLLSILGRKTLKQNKIITELKEQVEDWKSDHEENLRLMKGLNERIENLEKENAELKDKFNKIERKCKFNFVDLLHDVENESKLEKQLTKAKELIKDFLLMAKVEHLKDRYETVDEAEQFISEVEK